VVEVRMGQNHRVDKFVAVCNLLKQGLWQAIFWIFSGIEIQGQAQIQENRRFLLRKLYTGSTNLMSPSMNADLH